MSGLPLQGWVGYLCRGEWAPFASARALSSEWVSYLRRSEWATIASATALSSEWVGYLCRSEWAPLASARALSGSPSITVSAEKAKPRNPPNQETQIPRYKYISKFKLNLNLYCETLGNLSFSMWWISGVSIFSENCHTILSTSLIWGGYD